MTNTKRGASAEPTGKSYATMVFSGDDRTMRPRRQLWIERSSQTFSHNARIAHSRIEKSEVTRTGHMAPRSVLETRSPYEPCSRPSRMKSTIILEIALGLAG